MSQQQQPTERYSFVPCRRAPADIPYCDTPACRRRVAWYETVRHLFLCEGCAMRLVEQLQKEKR